VVGAALRLTNLGFKSPASIEISSMGFSLGNGFSNVPLDKLIDLNTLLSPLQFSQLTTIKDVVHNLITETNHPPLFFVITHFWLKLFSPTTELDILWLIRLESAILGMVSIAAIFILVWLSFRSPTFAQIAAALMAVSPYGIYLAQEARHYTLTILWIIASLGFLVGALRSIEQRKKLPWLLVFPWIMVNTLGIITHDLFYLVLLAEGIIVGIIRLSLHHQNNQSWRRLYIVIFSTFICCLLALIFLKSGSTPELTEWIDTNYDLARIWQPIPRLLAWLITMIFLLPVEGTPLTITILSGVVLSLVLLWLAPILIKKLVSQYRETPLFFGVFATFFLSTIVIFIFVIYIWGKDLSQAARYQFVYFPCAIILVAVALGGCWKSKGEKLVIATLLLGLLGGLTVINNYGYQKSQRADLLAQHILSSSPVPVIIASAYYTHAELRSLIALGMELKSLHKEKLADKKFILISENVRQYDGNLLGLETVLQTINRPLDLWTINLKLNEEKLQKLACMRARNQPDINGYRYRIYHCEAFS
jgi:uncharacterized membrane protein